MVPLECPTGDYRNPSSNEGHERRECRCPAEHRRVHGGRSCIAARPDRFASCRAGRSWESWPQSAPIDEFVRRRRPPVLRQIADSCTRRCDRYLDSQAAITSIQPFLRRALALSTMSAIVSGLTPLFRPSSSARSSCSRLRIVSGQGGGLCLVLAVSVMIKV